MAARLFYLVLHVLIVAILLLYDNRLRLLIVDFELVEPLLYAAVIGVTTWMFVTCGDRPGAVLKEISEVELEAQRKEVEEYWKEHQDEGENEGELTEESTRDERSERIAETEVSENTPFQTADGAIDDEEAGVRKCIAGKPKDKTNEDDKESKYEMPPLHFCHRCNIVQEYRTRHCKSCDACIAKFDHHCFWIGNHVSSRQLRRRTESSQILVDASCYDCRVRMEHLLRSFVLLDMVWPRLQQGRLRSREQNRRQALF